VLKTEAVYAALLTRAATAAYPQPHAPDVSAPSTAAFKANSSWPRNEACRDKAVDELRKSGGAKKPAGCQVV
jgi:hypothetical protein